MPPGSAVAAFSTTRRLSDPAGIIGSRPRAGYAVAEFVGNNDVLFGPQSQHRPIATIAVPPLEGRLPDRSDPRLSRSIPVASMSRVAGFSFTSRAKLTSRTRPRYKPRLSVTANCMANHKSAEKRIRQTAKRTAINRARVSRVRTFVKSPPAGATRAASGDNQGRAPQEHGLAQVVAAGRADQRALTRDRLDRCRGGMPQMRPDQGFLGERTASAYGQKNIPMFLFRSHCH
jgi:small subunit ribosomal protein S20